MQAPSTSTKLDMFSKPEDEEEDDDQDEFFKPKSRNGSSINDGDDDGGVDSFESSKPTHSYRPSMIPNRVRARGGGTDMMEEEEELEETQWTNEVCRLLYPLYQ